MNDTPTTLDQKLEGLPKDACNVNVLDEHCLVKRPYLFYYEEALDSWAIAMDDVASIVGVDNFSDDGEEIEIKFRSINMTDFEFHAMTDI